MHRASEPLKRPPQWRRKVPLAGALVGMRLFRTLRTKQIVNSIHDSTLTFQLHDQFMQVESWCGEHML
eukprot:5992291-Prymnesium_polylepis.1